MKEKHSIGKIISKLRKDLGWTQVELAEKLQVSDKTISKWESDKGEPSLEFLPELAKIFNVSIDYIMVGENEAEKKSSADKEKAIAKLKKEKEKRKAEIEEKKMTCLHNGIINIEELLAFNDFDVTKEMLEAYPITFYELLYNMIEKQQYKQLFEFSVDNNLKSLKTKLIKGNFENLNQAILSLIKMEITNPLYKLEAPNHKYIALKTNGIYRGLINIEKLRNSQDKPAYVEQFPFEGVMGEIKSKILYDLSLKLDKQKKTEGLTREFFNQKLASGDIETVIIKLCVKLEMILRYDYHYEGEFSEMLSEYTQTLTEDDGWGYPSEMPIAKLLHKLRKQRNNIVHPDDDETELSTSEIKDCIDFICRIDKE